jgi:hypothetical protein
MSLSIQGEGRRGCSTKSSRPCRQGTTQRTGGMDAESTAPSPTPTTGTLEHEDGSCCRVACLIDTRCSQKGKRDLRAPIRSHLARTRGLRAGRSRVQRPDLCPMVASYALFGRLVRETRRTGLPYFQCSRSSSGFHASGAPCQMIVTCSHRCPARSLGSARLLPAPRRAIGGASS